MLTKTDSNTALMDGEELNGMGTRSFNELESVIDQMSSDKLSKS
jgi:hypothetical protein